MTFKRLTNRRKFLVIIWTFFGLSVICRVYPSAYNNLFPFSVIGNDAANRIADLFFNVLLALISFLAGSLGSRALFGRPITESYNLPPHIVNNHTGYAEPCKKLVIYDRYPSFSNPPEIHLFLRRAGLYANYRVITTSILSELEAFLSKSDVQACICDSLVGEEIVRLTRSRSKSLITIAPEPSGKYFEQRGNSISKIGLPVTMLSQNRIIELFSKMLVGGHSLDTPRGIGFHGNWAGTYGILSLHQQNDFEVNGYYFYANGNLSGKCYLDIEDQILILEYKWSQDKNDNPVGSRSVGDGVFVMPAGHEFFFGYWRDIGDSIVSQPWCAARMSQDITESIRSGIPPFGNDFGINIHPRSHIISWGLHKDLT